MAKQIIWSPQAVADRIQILDYWYKRLGTQDYSTKLDETFKETVQLLSRFPLLGRQLEDREIINSISVDSRSTPDKYYFSFSTVSGRNDRSGRLLCGGI